MARRPTITLLSADPAVEAARPIIVAGDRPPVQDFLAHLGLPAIPVPLALTGVELEELDLDGVGLAILDFALDPTTALRTCERLRERRPSLPIAAVVCCPHSITPQNVRALAAAGVASMLDLQVSSREMRRAVEAAARGASVLHLSFGGRRRATLHDIISGKRLRSESDVRLLELVALGLPDREIGLQLHLSPHTVKKHIEQLRDEVGARNRIELAAWAGRQGLYATRGERTSL